MQWQTYCVDSINKRVPDIKSGFAFNTLNGTSLYCVAWMEGSHENTQVLCNHNYKGGNWYFQLCDTFTAACIKKT